MAELAALSLAGNIVQFVDFGIRLFRDLNELYKSPEGAKAEHLELEAVTTDLKCLAQNLQQTVGPSTQDDIALGKLAAGCEKLACELLGVLDKLKVKKEQNQKLASFQQVLILVLKEKDVRALEKRLEKYREQLSKRLIYFLRFVSA
jgi:hypothetical protein